MIFTMFTMYILTHLSFPDRSMNEIFKLALFDLYMIDSHEIYWDDQEACRESTYKFLSHSESFMVSQKSLNIH